MMGIAIKNWHTLVGLPKFIYFWWFLFGVLKMFSPSGGKMNTGEFHLHLAESSKTASAALESNTDGFLHSLSLLSLYLFLTSYP